MPVLIECLSDTNDAVVRPAASALSGMQAEPDICVPMLLGLIRHTNSMLRAVAVISLGQYGTNARSSIPALIEATGDSDEWVRKWATNALKKIAPEVLETNRVTEGHAGAVN